VGWAKRAKQSLLGGETAIVSPKGNSMSPKVESGATVTLEPVDPDTLKKGDVVLVTVKGRDYLHLVKARRGKQLLIGNNKGGTNGWVGPHAIYGKATKIEQP
jgi:hypothetical protein